MANIKRANTSGITKSGSAIADVPDAPVIGAATNVGTSRAYNNGSATVAFTANATGGTPASYTATSTPGSFTASGAGSPLTVTGLQSATSYTFAVTGTNTTATGAASAASSSITATTIPATPSAPTATDTPSGRAYNNGAASVAFTAPATGGSAISSYTVTSTPGSFTASGSSSPITVTGQQSATAYTYTITATNANGTSTASSASASTTATTVPQAPTIGTATTSGSGVMSIPFTAGATGGSAVSTYTATSSSGRTATSASSPIALTEITAGSYTYTVTATNANGTSTASSASNSVTAAFPFALLAQGGGSNTIYLSKSTDGLATWSNLSIPVTGANHAAYGSTLSTDGAGTWVLGGSNYTINQGGIWYSTNSAATWTAVAVAVPNAGNTQIGFIHAGDGYGGGYWVMGGARRTGQPAFIHYTTTASLSSWTYAATGTGSALSTNTVIYAANMTNKWWTTIEGGKTLYSTSNPPSSWTQVTGSAYNQSNTATNGTTVVWAGSQRYANQQYVTTSGTNATTFTLLDYGSSAVAYGNGKFMIGFRLETDGEGGVIGSNTSLIYTSTSGTGSWSASTSPWGMNNSITSGGYAGKFYISNNDGAYATSTDALTWTIIGQAPLSAVYPTIKYGLQKRKEKMTYSTNWYYEVDETDGNTIRIYDGVSTVPFILQPHWPDGTPWATKQEAENWATATIASNNPDEPMEAGHSPLQPLVAKKTPQELAAMRLQATGLTVDDLKALLGL